MIRIRTNAILKGPYKTLLAGFKDLKVIKMKLPPYDHFPYLCGENISLRQIHVPEINDHLEICFYNAVQAYTLQQAIEMQARIDKDYMDGNSIHWGIAHNQRNNIVGTCGFYRGLDKGEGELGCVLLPQYRGHGFMTSAMQLAVEFGMNEIGLKRIRAITTQHNDKAIQLLQRLNFSKVAHLNDGAIEYELRAVLAKPGQL